MSAKNKTTSKAAKVREFTTSDLEVKIAALRAELLDLRIKQGTGQLENPIQLRHLRRDIARHITIGAQKKAAETAPAGTTGAAAAPVDKPAAKTTAAKAKSTKAKKTAK
ncbi:MAG: 50S ribosomal protein L29 [Puniceicoccales bacterium]|jgi:large subunit ribosomal protein L29|nr:50S ribosomal protein L29 [Puniceicoccales bacterium]